MMDVPVVVRGELVVKTADLPDLALEQIRGALSFKNEDKAVAIREKLPGAWNLPDTVDLWRVEERRGGDEVLCLPRGFAGQLAMGIKALGGQVVWEDHRVMPTATDGYFRYVDLRDYQQDAALDIMRSQQGGVEMPPGAGKTRVALATMALANTPALVIVDKAGLLEQWRLRAHQAYGFAVEEVVHDDGTIELVAPLDGDQCVGKIGDDIWEERTVTIALRQTLHSRAWQLQPTGWWEKWGATWWDEHHHLAAETVEALCRMIRSRMSVGISATPERTETKGKVVHALIGPTIHRTTRGALYERGVLMKPRVVQIPTGFTADFWPTHDSEPDGTCLMIGCKKKGRHGHRNNYTSIVKHLVEDDARNVLIGRLIAEQRGHVHLVPSRQLKHLKLIEAALVEAGWDGPIFMLRGEENARGESQKIAQQIASSHEAIVLSTVADEGLDIPPIDRLWIVFPMRQESGTIQLVGRVERAVDGKEDAVVYDLIDESQVFADQAAERERAYRKQGLVVETSQPSIKTVERVDRSLPRVGFTTGHFSSFSERWPIVTTHPFRPDERLDVPTREHLFQAFKATNEEDFDRVFGLGDHGPCTAQQAKTRGRKITLRDGWDDGLSYEKMRLIIRAQCRQHDELAKLLEDTGLRPIVETRHDPIWGIGPDGGGQNLLGEAWVDVRFERRTIAFMDTPDRNERRYKCGKCGTDWMVPLDDCPSPVGRDDECPECAQFGIVISLDNDD